MYDAGRPGRAGLGHEGDGLEDRLPLLDRDEVLVGLEAVGLDADLVGAGLDLALPGAAPHLVVVDEDLADLVEGLDAQPAAERVGLDHELHGALEGDLDGALGGGELLPLELHGVGAPGRPRRSTGPGPSPCRRPTP